MIAAVAFALAVVTYAAMAKGIVHDRTWLVFGGFAAWWAGVIVIGLAT